MGRRRPRWAFRLERLDENLTPAECGAFYAQTHTLHPSSKWCGFVTNESCGTDGRVCNGRCRDWRSLTPAARSGFLRLVREGRADNVEALAAWAAEHGLRFDASALAGFR